jgi:hypothetical protein
MRHSANAAKHKPVETCLWEKMHSFAQEHGTGYLIPFDDPCCEWNWSNSNSSLTKLFADNNWTYRVSSDKHNGEIMYFEGKSRNSDLFCKLKNTKVPGTKVAVIYVKRSTKEEVESKRLARLKAIRDEEKAMGYECMREDPLDKH